MTENNWRLGLKDKKLRRAGPVRLSEDTEHTISMDSHRHTDTCVQTHAGAARLTHSHPFLFLPQTTAIVSPSLF